MEKNGAVQPGSPSVQRRSVIVLVCILGILLIAAQTSLANGHSITVFLGYTPGISNWGAFEANGLATIKPSDGQVHLVVNQLPHDPHIQYQAWVVPAGEEPTTMIALGSFNVDRVGHAQVDLTRADLHTREYRLFVITAEPVPDRNEAPDARRALAGVFPNSKADPLAEDPRAFADLLDENASPSSDGAVDPATSDQTPPQKQNPRAPSTLPVTGAVLPTCSGAEVTALAAGLLMVTLGNAISRLHQIHGRGGER